tara:strand:- start:312 stop:1376 length:1065 start_codon:yes stop_codon:yes gene_type:complete
MTITRVTTDGITDNAVSTAKIGANAVDTTKIGADVIVADDIADNAITVAQIQDGAITAAKIADNTITGAKLNSTISGNRSLSGDITLSGTVRMPVATSDPGSGTAGQLYYNTTDNVLKIYTGSEWLSLATTTLQNSTFDIFGDNSTVGLWQLDINANDVGGNYALSGSTGSGNFTSGKFGSAFNGNGTRYLRSTNVGIQNALTGGYSLSFWYNSSNAGQNNKRVFTVKGNAQATGWSNFNNSLGFYKGTGGQNQNSAASVTRVAQIPDAAVNDGSWHHLVYTITSSGSFNIYLDGSLYSGAVSGEGRSFDNGAFLSITTYDGGTGYNSIAKIDQARLLNRVINATEVSQLYTAI